MPEARKNLYFGPFLLFVSLILKVNVKFSYACDMRFS
ncbi:Uncharacterised protein [Cedecea lapagei]|uniref:Uncharacterized protein n=1 Tax=Cedecea lapagei TaxID=158823 RepID=A0A447V618_9ENTR|nr:Uncharacterised protein [Cedecea lapagei]